MIVLLVGVSLNVVSKIWILMPQNHKILFFRNLFIYLFIIASHYPLQNEVATPTSILLVYLLLVTPVAALAFQQLWSHFPDDMEDCLLLNGNTNWLANLYFILPPSGHIIFAVLPDPSFSLNFLARITRTRIHMASGFAEGWTQGIVIIKAAEHGLFSQQNKFSNAALVLILKNMRK